jgi:pyrroline-5-carboxylate reductase
VILVLGLGTLAFCLLMALLDAAVKWRNGGVTESQADDLRQLISRYEQLAEKTLDAQQRAAVDVAELRVRLASIEQILRTVE